MPSKYRRKVFSSSVEKTLKTTCKGISERYEIVFVEIGSDEDHVHFLVQSVPNYSPKKVVQTIKSITAIQIFKHHPEVKRSYGVVNFGRVDIILIQLGNMEMLNDKAIC